MASELPLLPHGALDALQALSGVFEAHQIAYALIGGVATSYRSRPRTTRDLDFVVQIPQLKLPGLLDDLRAEQFEFDLATVVRQYVQEHMTVLMYQGVRIDWLKPMLPFYQHVINSAEVEEWMGLRVFVATPASLILTKLLPFRSQDQVDIENLLAANRGQLDLDYIRQEWNTVAEPDDPRMIRFEEMVSEYYNPPPSEG